MGGLSTTFVRKEITLYEHNKCQIKKRDFNDHEDWILFYSQNNVKTTAVVLNLSSTRFVEVI